MTTHTTWRKSSRSGGQQDCVEVADHVAGRTVVRDTKLGGASPVLAFAPESWRAFVASVKSN